MVKIDQSAKVNDPKPATAIFKTGHWGWKTASTEILADQDEAEDTNGEPAN
jgi:hypothetical protein